MATGRRHACHSLTFLQTPTWEENTILLLLIYSTAIFAINACDACDKPRQRSLFICIYLIIL